MSGVHTRSMTLVRLCAVVACVVLSVAPLARADSGADLAALPVKAWAPMAGYSRAQFGPPWVDHDGPWGDPRCDTRDVILARDLTDVVRRGCIVESGVLHDPYTGKVITFTRGPSTSLVVQIDHVVPLGDAWRTGAQDWPLQKRVDLANDPSNLLAVDGPANESKGDSDASQWLPPDVAFRCTYVEDQIAVKIHYHLWVTEAEHTAMAAVLARCS